MAVTCSDSNAVFDGSSQVTCIGTIFAFSKEPSCSGFQLCKSKIQRSSDLAHNANDKSKSVKSGRNFTPPLKIKLKREYLYLHTVS